MGQEVGRITPTCAGPSVICRRAGRGPARQRIRGIGVGKSDNAPGAISATTSRERPIAPETENFNSVETACHSVHAPWSASASLSTMYQDHTIGPHYP